MIRFVQFADVHLDSTIGGTLNLPSEKKAVLRQDLRTAFGRACDLARERHADLVLIPGDLFDHESMLPDTASFIVDALSAVQPARVIVAPGNHDSLRPGSPYLASSGIVWPDNVHVFTSLEFDTVELSDIDCSITSIAHAHRGNTDRLLAAPIPTGSCGVRILIIHGSRDGYRPSDKENVIPFSDSELVAQDFSYAAIGHYHSFARIEDRAGRIRAAYSGCLQGRGLDETGEKCAIVGEISPSGEVTLERVEVAPRRILAADVDITGAGDSQSVIERIDRAVSDTGAREQDIVRVSVCGRLSPDVVLDTSAIESSGAYFHISVSRSRVEPDYDLEALARDSAASRLRSEFVRRMLDRRDANESPDEQRTLTDAIYYGLGALDGRKPEPRDAD